MHCSEILPTPIMQGWWLPNLVYTAIATFTTPLNLKYLRFLNTSLKHSTSVWNVNNVTDQSITKTILLLSNNEELAWL